MPSFIDALCYLFPWRSWIIRPLIIARSSLSHKTTRAGLALCQPGTNFDFLQITEQQLRFAHFSAFRRNPCISLWLRSRRMKIGFRSCAWRWCTFTIHVCQEQACLACHWLGCWSILKAPFPKNLRGPHFAQLLLFCSRLSIEKYQ